MTLSRLAGVLTKASRVVRDVNAVKRGRVIERAENRAIGHAVWRVLRGIWR